MKSKRVQELEKAVATMEAGMTRLEKENAELNDLLSDPEARIAALEAENAGLKAKAESLKDALDRMRDGTDASPVLIAGRETDLYEDEAKEILMDILKAAAGKMAKGTRRRDVIDSIMEANPVGGIPARNAGIVQNAMKGYRGMDPGVERALRETGIAFAVSGGNHVRLTYMDDSRYRVTLSSSTSDRRAGENAAADIVKQMF